MILANPTHDLSTWVCYYFQPFSNNSFESQEKWRALSLTSTVSPVDCRGQK